MNDIKSEFMSEIKNEISGSIKEMHDMLKQAYPNYIPSNKDDAIKDNVT